MRLILNFRPRPLAENVAGSQDSLHSGGRRNEDSQKPVGKVQPAKSNDQSLASSNENRKYNLNTCT